MARPKISITVAAVILVFVVAATGIFLNSSRTKTQENQPTPKVSSGSTSIQITASGFVPTSLTVKQGSTVTFVNQDTEEHWPASDSHPSHQIYPEFDPLRGIKPGKKWSFKFDKLGIWEFHDHLFANFKGTIKVTER